MNASNYNINHFGSVNNTPYSNDPESTRLNIELQDMNNAEEDYGATRSRLEDFDEFYHPALRYDISLRNVICECVCDGFQLANRLLFALCMNSIEDWLFLLTNTTLSRTSKALIGCFCALSIILIVVSFMGILGYASYISDGSKGSSGSIFNFF